MTEASDTMILAFGNHELDFGRRELREDGRPVELPPTPLRVLLYLAEHRDRAVPKNELMDTIWPDAIVTDTSLANALNQARHAVGDDGTAQRVIRTQKGIGYRFVADGSIRQDSGRRVVPAAPIRSLAVLPLENLSGDPEQEYFADGMTDALIGDLARIGGLRVVSRHSVMHYKRSDLVLPEIARELDVDGVIEGTVMRAGDRVRITAQLVDARSDQHLWSDRYDRELSDVLALHSEVARAVAEHIRLELTPEEDMHLGESRTVDPAAHDAYLRGWLHMGKAAVPNRLRAIAYFEQAIEHDPKHALAYAGLARCYFEFGYGLFHLSPREAMPQARAAAEKALELDDSLGNGHTTLGMVLGYHDWAWEQGEAELRRGVELSPSDPWSLGNYGHYLTALGRHDEAFAFLERALGVASLDLTWKVHYAIGRLYAREYERAVEECLQMLEIQPDYLWAPLWLMWSYQALGRDEEAYRASVEWHRRTGRDEDWLRGFEHGHSEAGFEGALRYWARADTERAKTQYVDATIVAVLYSAIGDVDAAFEWLHRACEERTVSLAGSMLGAAALDPIRDDPRFQAILERMGLAD